MSALQLAKIQCLVSAAATQSKKEVILELQNGAKFRLPLNPEGLGLQTIGKAWECMTGQDWMELEEIRREVQQIIFQEKTMLFSAHWNKVQSIELFVGKPNM